MTNSEQVLDIFFKFIDDIDSNGLYSTGFRALFKNQTINPDCFMIKRDKILANLDMDIYNRTVSAYEKVKLIFKADKNQKLFILPSQQDIL